MTISNFERIGKCLHTLKEGLSPFVIQQFRATYSTTWKEQLKEVTKDDRFSVVSDDKIDWDIQAVLNVMWFSWNEVFNKVLGHAECSFVSELKEIRNNWAHQQSFKTDDAYRAIDTMTRLLQAISSPIAPQLDQQKQELLRLRFEEQARNETKKINAAQTSGQPSQGLKPWRDVVTPHADVMSGLYTKADGTRSVSAHTRCSQTYGCCSA